MGDVIITYEVFSKPGRFHKKNERPNEDALVVLEKEDYVCCFLSDGAGSSPFAKEASFTTVQSANDYCASHFDDFFDETNRAIITKELVFNIQQKLYEKANELKTELSQMTSTLIVFGINKKTSEYIIIHIGDGLVAGIKNNNTTILSFPENGITKQYTYFVNSSSVFDHLRTTRGKYTENEMFFIGSDGCFENCYTDIGYETRIKTIKNYTEFEDDVSYCIIKPTMV